MHKLSSLLFLVACTEVPAETRVGVENVGTAPASVTLTAGDQTEVFADVAAGTASEARVVDWTTLTGVTVTVDAGGVEPGTVDLTTAVENVVIIGPDPPAVEIVAPPAPAGGGGNTGW